MKILWTHNFNPAAMNSGSFMHIFATSMRRFGVELDLHYTGPLNNPRALINARRNIRELANGYDILHAQFGSACAFVSAAAKIPKILSLRGSDWYRYQERVNSDYFHSIAATVITGLSLTHYDSVIVMSNRMKLEVQVRYPLASVDVLTDPIDLAQFAPMSRPEARKLLGFENDTSQWILFTTLSKQNPIKRVGLAQKAVEIANRNLGGLKLKIATGLRHDQMPIFVASCNMVLSTSVHEGWPNCVKEAMACNLPFVATNVSDLPDIAAIENSCRICPPDPQALADGIAHVLRSPPTDLRRHLFGMDLVPSCRELLTLYERVANRCSRR